MSSPDLILDALRARLRAAGITYKLLAERIGVSESSVKRMFGQKDMALSRLAAQVMAGNPASARVLLKNGFDEEGVERQSVLKDGQLHDMRCFARLRMLP